MNIFNSETFQMSSFSTAQVQVTVEVLKVDPLAYNNITKSLVDLALRVLVNIYVSSVTNIKLIRYGNSPCTFLWYFGNIAQLNMK